jgi:hypothetical protein
MEENRYLPPGEPKAGSSLRTGRAALVPVAIALLVVSILWIILSLFGIEFFLFAVASPDADAELRRMDLMYSVYLAIEILYCWLLVMGTFSMIGRGSYTWAVVTACLACVPCLSPLYMLGIPIGIWALVVLRRPEVKAAFRKL